jgi:hypothetical protein
MTEDEVQALVDQNKAEIQKIIDLGPPHGDKTGPSKPLDIHVLAFSIVNELKFNAIVRTLYIHLSANAQPCFVKYIISTNEWESVEAAEL